jgi:PAS domain S-box-containing protein
MTSQPKLSASELCAMLQANQDAYQALKHSQFVPFFQPIITLRTGQLAGYEVLARWQHTTEGIIPPDRFIGVAERDGWIDQLTRQVLEKAFAAASAIPHPLTLSINISPFQLWNQGWPEELRALANHAGFSPARLIVEITESALIGNRESAAALVSELKAMGCKLALDDFGTGYSSLHHLQALPFDELKVDRSFVSSMTTNRESRKIVSAVVGLGQSLGLVTVAEGIETQEQAEMMLWLGCELGQGYFYGRPIPAADLAVSILTQRQKLVTHTSSPWKRISDGNLDVSPSQRLAQLQAVYDGAPVGLAFIDQNLHYVNLNKRLADMNGASVEDHLGSKVSEMIPSLFPYVEPYIRRALHGEAISDVEVQLPDSGETRLVSYQPALDEAGEVVGVSVATLDITERTRTDEALKQSEAHYRSMVELNPQVLWIMDPQGRNLDVSPRWDKKSGLMMPKSDDHDWLAFVHPEDIQPTVRAMAEFRRKGAPIDVEYRVANSPDTWQWKRSRGSPRFDANGNIICWYGSVQDTEAPGAKRGHPAASATKTASLSTGMRVARFSAGEAEKEKRHQAILDLEILDTPAEAEFEDLVYMASELCSAPISLVSFLDSDRQWSKASVGLDSCETPINSSFCLHAVEQQQGLFVVEDASKDKRFKHNPLVTGDPHIRFYAGMPLYAGDGVGIGALCVIDTVPRSLSPWQAKALNILSQQVQARIELRSGRKKQIIDIKARRELMSRLEKGKVVLREANQKQEQLYVELKQTQLQHMADESELQKRCELDVLKNEYVAMVSHELRAPLTSVRGAVGMLSAGLIGLGTDKSAKLFHIALTNLDRMTRLVNDALNLERITSGTSSLRVQQCSVEDLMKQAIDTMMSVAQELNVQIIATAITEIRGTPLFFNGDADKILQVLINLLSNALKFSPARGKVVLDVVASSDSVTVRICDEGRGIPVDQLETVFERFRQLEQGDERRLGGTGLGLAICRAIVEQHGGVIRAERNSVRGTSFFVTLPRSVPALINDDSGHRGCAA